MNRCCVGPWDGEETMPFSLLRKLVWLYVFIMCLRNRSATVTKRLSGSHGCLTWQSGSLSCASEGLMTAHSLITRRVAVGSQGSDFALNSKEASRLQTALGNLCNIRMLCLPAIMKTHKMQIYFLNEFIGCLIEFGTQSMHQAAVLKTI